MLNSGIYPREFARSHRVMQVGEDSGGPLAQPRAQSKASPISIV